MAGENRASPDHLSYLREAASSVRSYGFFALLRALESRAPSLPRIGRSRMPQQNVAELAHEPLLEFAGYTISEIEPAKPGRARIRSTFLGLTGPMGALPLHLSEYAQLERRHAKMLPFGRFLDLLTGRMLQFFYRAWADSQPVTHVDRNSDDRFAGYLLRLIGFPEDEKRRAIPRRGLIGYAGLLSSSRSPGAIQDFISRLLGVRAQMREFVPQWRNIEQPDRTRIGAESYNNALSSGAVLGERSLMVDDTFHVVVNCRDLEEYESLLPGGRKFLLASEALDAISPAHIDWRLELSVAEQDVRTVVLNGGARVGWTTWLAPIAGAVRRADVRLGRHHAVLSQSAEGEL